MDCTRDIGKSVTCHIRQCQMKARTMEICWQILSLPMDWSIIKTQNERRTTGWARLQTHCLGNWHLYLLRA